MLTLLIWRWEMWLLLPWQKVTLHIIQFLASREGSVCWCMFSLALVESLCRTMIPTPILSSEKPLFLYSSLFPPASRHLPSLKLSPLSSIVHSVTKPFSYRRKWEEKKLKSQAKGEEKWKRRKWMDTAWMRIVCR